MRAAIAGLGGVAGVDVLDAVDGRATLQALASEGASLAATVSELTRARGWQVHALTVERGRLDEVFREITASGVAHG